MPASASSPITVLAARTGPVNPGLEPGQEGDLLVALRAVPDPRQRRGRRHRLFTVLAVSGSNENLNHIVREYFPKGEPITADPTCLPWCFRHQRATP